MKEFGRGEAEALVLCTGAEGERKWHWSQGKWDGTCYNICKAHKRSVETWCVSEWPAGMVQVCEPPSGFSHVIHDTCSPFCLTEVPINSVTCVILKEKRWGESCVRRELPKAVSLVKKLLAMNFLIYLCYKSRALYWLFNNLAENTYTCKTRG